jgi:hypothetical protein
MKVAITGATGFVGSRLVQKLYADGYQAVILTRNLERAKRIFPASVFPTLLFADYSEDWSVAIAGCDGVVNLAGAAIAEHRWTPEQKQMILSSRRDTTFKVVEAIAQAKSRPSVLVSASAIGYYGTSETASFDESSPAGDDFLAHVCQEWEAAAAQVKSYGTRLVILRIGIVLGPGGALGRMVPAFKLFAGGPLGTGQQWFSWIERDDLVHLIQQSLACSQFQGMLNATTPQPVRMNELCQALGQVMGRPSWLPVPGAALELLLGEGAKVVLEGQKVLPKRTIELGFDYQNSDLKSALVKALKEI